MMMKTLSSKLLLCSRNWEKVRKMRASPFNKKSGSVLGRVGQENKATENEENSGSAFISAST